jgi:Common central domain of tyrosinase
MSNLFSSSNDPLFYLHHGGIDHFWFQWQGRNKTKFQDIRRSVIDFHRLTEPVPADKGPEAITTLDAPVFQTGEFAPLIQISQVMDTINEDGNGFLCYVYDSQWVDFRNTPVAKSLPNGGAPNRNGYPSLPAGQEQPSPWVGAPPNEDPDFTFDQESSIPSANDSMPEHHHPETAAVTTSVLAAKTPAPTLINSSPEPTEVVMSSKAKTSDASSLRIKSFLGLGALLRSNWRSSSSSSDPNNRPALPVVYNPLPEYTSLESNFNSKEEHFFRPDLTAEHDMRPMQGQAPPGGYAPKGLAESRLIPLPDWIPGQQGVVVEELDDD